jgi:predicted aconitase
MKLTPEEESMLAGEQGHAVRKSMQILTALGRIFGAERLLPVATVQISGVSYDNLGQAGLEYLRSMAADGRVRVPTTLNPAGMDLCDWRAFAIPEEFAEKQLEVVEAFRAMGVKTTCSCTPYLIGNVPERGTHIAWGESSAVAFANSVLGARTNKEGGPSSIAAALTGRTPAYGLHLTAERAPRVAVEVACELETAADFGALGKVIAEAAPAQIPLIGGVTTRRWDRLKALSAAIATYGGASLFHIEGVTPEAGEWPRPEQRLRIGREEIARAYAELDDGAAGAGAAEAGSAVGAGARAEGGPAGGLSGGGVDLVFLGCPHLSLDELEEIANLLKGRTVHGELWLGVAREVKERADTSGLSARITRSGARFACDTCHVVAPLKGRFRTFATNSAKGVYYGRAKNRFKSSFGSLATCIELATRGGAEQ